MAFEAELAVGGVKDGFDPLPNVSGLADECLLVLADGADQGRARSSVMNGSKLRRA
jgi:hypothetical protein